MCVFAKKKHKKEEHYDVQYIILHNFKIILYVKLS
jgi:hypothetical protein